MTNFARIAAAVAMVLCGAAEVQAQSADAGASLQGTVKAGDRLTITTLAGTNLAGRLVRTEGEALVIRTSGGEQAVAYSDVDRVRRRRNGIKAGATFGLLGGVLWGLLVSNVVDDEIDSGTVLLMTTAMGVGAGVGLDALIGSNRTIFKRPTAGSPAVGLQPTRGGAAVRWPASW